MARDGSCGAPPAGAVADVASADAASAAAGAKLARSTRQVTSLLGNAREGDVVSLIGSHYRGTALRMGIASTQVAIFRG
jgi:hypothetical protein